MDAAGPGRDAVGAGLRRGAAGRRRGGSGQGKRAAAVDLQSSASTCPLLRCAVSACPSQSAMARSRSCCGPRRFPSRPTSWTSSDSTMTTGTDVPPETPAGTVRSPPRSLEGMNTIRPVTSAWTCRRSPCRGSRHQSSSSRILSDLLQSSSITVPPACTVALVSSHAASSWGRPPGSTAVVTLSLPLR